MTERKRVATITGKATKQDLVRILQSSEISDQTLRERVAETLGAFQKDMTKVLKKDLLALAQEVVDLTNGVSAPVPVEASLKPVSKVDDKKTAKKGKKATAEKKGAKVKKSTEDTVETIPPVTNVGADNLPSAKLFPAEIEVPELGKLVLGTGFDTYADVLNALNEGKELYFASYWSKRQIKEFSYAVTKMVPAETVNKGFPNDLDIMMAVLSCENVERIYAMSVYTEALFQFEGEDFQYVEDVDPRDGSEFRVRVSAGMEFEIYVPVE